MNPLRSTNQPHHHTPTHTPEKPQPNTPTSPSPAAVAARSRQSSSENLLADPVALVTNSGAQSAGRTPEDDETASGGGGRRRSSSVWKGLNIKRRLSKVNTKISSTLMGGDASARRGSPLPCTAVVSPVTDEEETEPPAAASVVSVVDVQPDMVETAESSRKNSSTRTNSDEDVIEEAVAADETTPVDTIFEPASVDASGNELSRDVLAATVEPSGDSSGDRQSASAEDAEPPAGGAADPLAAAISRGAIPKDVRFALPQSRPTELSLFDSPGRAQPVPMLRTKRNRMQSVPNIKLNRQDTTKLSDLRDAVATGTQPAATAATQPTAVPAAAAGTSASDAGTSSSLMDMFRRFSKYKCNHPPTKPPNPKQPSTNLPEQKKTTPKAQPTENPQN